MHMAATLFQVKTEMLKTDFTNLSELLPGSPGFSSGGYKTSFSNATGNSLELSQYFHSQFMLTLDLNIARCWISWREGNHCFPTKKLWSYSSGMTLFWSLYNYSCEKLVWTTTNRISFLYQYTSHSLYINAPVRSRQTKSRSQLLFLPQNLKYQYWKQWEYSLPLCLADPLMLGSLLGVWGMVHQAGEVLCSFSL